MIPVDPTVRTELSLLSVNTSDPLDHFDFTLVAGMIRTFQGYRGGSAYMKKQGGNSTLLSFGYHTIALGCVACGYRGWPR